MNQQEFEHRVLELWMRSRVPLTLANVLYCTGAPRKKSQRWLDDMVKEGVLEVDADDDGELIWAVRGAARAANGPTTVAEWDKIGRLRSEAGVGASNAAGAALMLASRGAKLVRGGADGQKSLVASGLLSFFFGPLGWLYAAPLGEAIPAILVYGVICAIFPAFLLKMILPLVSVASTLGGLAYAWKHNANGQRTPLLGGGDTEPRALPPKKRP